VGGVLARREGVFLEPTLCLAALSAALVAAGGNAVNDAFDAEIDSLNRPARPIPSGRAGVVEAYLSGSALMAVGIGLGFALGWRLGCVAAAVSGLLWGYSSRLKRVILAGNAVVALCGGAAFIYGALAVHNPVPGAIPALFAFLIHLGREIVKDVEDLSGDRARGARTLPIAVGSRKALKIAAAALLLLAILTPLPHNLGIFGTGYLIIVLITVVIPILVMVNYLWRGLDHRGLGRTSLSLKLIMIGGLIALYVG